MGWLEGIKLAAIVGVPVSLAIVGYIVGAMKSLDAKNKATADDLARFKLEAAEKYVPRAELASALTTLRAEGKALEERLEKRFDKMEIWMGRRFDMLLGRLPSENS